MSVHSFNSSANSPEVGTGRHAHHGSTSLSVPCAVLTVSDTRTEETDTSGRLIRRLLVRHGHSVVDWGIVPDSPTRVRNWLLARARKPEISILILTGGTGVSPRDGTVEVLDRLLEKRLPGFGELFRMLSYRQVGSAAFLSRAAAGLYRGKAVFALPGAEAAVRLAMNKLILPELSHLLNVVNQGPAPRKRRGRRG